ncbi:DUF1642 domain-containing protein [Streptococcus mitis]|uniref:DUF1642 domain-containing protein n=1 Tax=Streptococcus mitis TaxID=28037 RepID=UPI002FD8BB6B
MKLKELIERIKRLDEPYLKSEFVLELVKQLDEPETGHADEAPRYIKNILARLRELPEHDREVWLKVIMSEFKQDFSHAKWREGYEQGKLEGMVEREKVKVPQFVDDVIEGAREHSPELEDALHYACSNGSQEFTEWYQKKSNRDLFARAWLDGYEVEKEKRYIVSLKNGQPLVKSQSGNTLYFNQNITAGNYKFTRKQLEEAGYGWVFDCPGIEIKEVE